MNKFIRDFYCNGFFGRRYDLSGAIIEGEGEDWIVIRIENGDVSLASFTDLEEKEKYVNEWT